MSISPLKDDERVEMNRILNFLAAQSNGTSTVTTKVLQHIMMDTGGFMMAGGYNYNIQSRRLAPGVYRIWLRGK